ncbi:MAG: type III-B CRISPR-associated protein Cas10/Cmr2 [Cyanobacteria bacterium P01_E01_bin.42]
MSVFHRKLCALLDDKTLCDTFDCLSKTSEGSDAWQWWQTHKEAIEAIASSSDRVSLEPRVANSQNPEVKHPISGQEQTIKLRDEKALNKAISPKIPQWIAGERDNVQKVFWWCWRFLPELKQQHYQDALLDPQHRILPDCPRHSFRATVAALVGAIPEDKVESTNPYLLLFTFSPVQEFIKASRKFLDFWAGSYLLHYLSAKLCWHVAQTYGADAVIVPSLWGQEIIDALLLKKYSDFAATFKVLGDRNPADRFKSKASSSLATAGFPNTISILIPAKDVEAIGKDLETQLTAEWCKIAETVRSDIRCKTIEFLQNNSIEKLIADLAASEGIQENRETNPNRRDIEQWKKPSCWEWNRLWEMQIENAWEPYWTAVPLGHPDSKRHLSVFGKVGEEFDKDWKQAQENIAPSRYDQPTPTRAEDLAYTELNVGTWWANAQRRLGQAIQAVKNTRVWRIPAAPGERSSISGFYSAVHPRLLYQGKFQEGGGLSAGTMQLFWRLLSTVYPGLFDGSEKLNAIELTKRMAWSYGGVADSLGIDPFEDNKRSEVESEDRDALDSDELARAIDYEAQIRFPNLSSIAAARYAKECPQLVNKYWYSLWQKVKNDTKDGKKTFSKKECSAFYGKTRRPKSDRAWHVPAADDAIAGAFSKSKARYNGVMFSGKWLADDMSLQDAETANRLRALVEETHKKQEFGDGSPADWWAIVLADGDGMGKYVTGSKLHPYEKYLSETDPKVLLEQIEGSEELSDRDRRNFIKAFQGREGEDKEAKQSRKKSLLKTKKRMGPATHIGLNRALLDFSNRLVPYLTEKRFCGRVVYSGGDDVMAVLPLQDLPEYLLSLRAAWCGGEDPKEQFQSHRGNNPKGSGYWIPPEDTEELPQRPLFTMGEGATISMGIVIAYKSVPLPTVLKSLWDAEKERAKKMKGFRKLPNGEEDPDGGIVEKDGLCFRVAYGSGNLLEAPMKGHLLPGWWKWIDAGCKADNRDEITGVLYRLAQELPKHADITKLVLNEEKDKDGEKLGGLVTRAARVIVESRDKSLDLDTVRKLYAWLTEWERWAYCTQQKVSSQKKSQGESQIEEDKDRPLGTTLDDLSRLLRFSAFWTDKALQHQRWTGGK